MKTVIERRSAFTLVELLVVFAIIALLAGLVVVSMSRARSKGRAAHCTSNLRQQGLALATFVQSHHVYPFYFPPGGISDQFPEHRTMWASAISEGKPVGLVITRDGEGSGGWFRCPSAFRPSDWPVGESFACYGYNAFGIVGKDGSGNLGLGGIGDSSATSFRPVPEASVARPSEFIAIGDGIVGNEKSVNDGRILISRSAETLSYPNAYARVRKRHSGDILVTFSDGHVQAIPFESLFSGEALLSHWNRDGLPHREKLQ